VATKQELAESMTIAELQDFAADNGIDLAGLSSKADIAERVANSASKDDLQAEADRLNPDADDQPPDDTSASSTPGATPAIADEGGGEEAPEINAEDHLLSAEAGDADLRPASEIEGDTQAATPESVDRISPADTAGLAAAGQSPADLELRQPQLATGEDRIVKARPEMPTAEQVKDSTTVVSGPPDVSVVVTDADGNEQHARVRPDDAARLAQVTASQQSGHPAHTSKGHWSNPNLTEMTDEEKEADAEAYADRVGG
jgi:hypothetical protein